MLNQDNRKSMKEKTIVIAKLILLNKHKVGCKNVDIGYVKTCKIKMYLYSRMNVAYFELKHEKSYIIDEYQTLIKTNANMFK